MIASFGARPCALMPPLLSPAPWQPIMLVKMSSLAGTDGVKMRREVCAQPRAGELPLFDLSGSWLLKPTLFKLTVNTCRSLVKTVTTVLTV